MGETSWAFLFVGTFGAAGAALALGTLAALLRYHRTGAFPGASDQQVSTGRLVVLWTRVAVGTVLAVLGVVMLQRADLI